MAGLGSTIHAVQLLHPVCLAMNVDCPECERFAANYTAATKYYLAILTTIQLALKENNAALVSEIEVLKEAAHEKRDAARQELRHHEATHSQRAEGVANPQGRLSHRGR